MNNFIKKILIKSNASITDALKKLEKTGLRCLVVVDKNKKYLGTITDGDIRKEILKNKDFTKKISKIYNLNSIYLTTNNFTKLYAEKLIKSKGITLLPIINKYLEPVDYFNLYESSSREHKQDQSHPVIIMAGGEGKRLQPFTSILPKPLIPVRGKPVLIHIMNLFKTHGYNNFYISVNTKDSILKSYLNELNKIYDFKYIEEKTPLGTAGALKRIKNIKKTFFIVNCDNLFKLNLKNLINFHNDNNNYLTLVASVKKFNVPYGVCELNKKNGNLVSMKEKPQKIVLANTGLYVCNPTILNYLPNKKKFGMNEVVNNLSKRKRKIGVFPIKDTEWKDTGNWLDYMNVIQKR